MDQDSTYDLPTPTRSNAAFLGWHTNQGREMVTNGTAMKSTYGHTLVAYWDTTGHSITKTDSYRNNFRMYPPAPGTMTTWPQSMSTA